MNKNELIDSMAAEAGMTKADAGKALDAFIASVTAALKKGDEIRLVGFGTFSVSKRAATTARNPRTGAEIKVAKGKRHKTDKIFIKHKLKNGKIPL